MTDCITTARFSFIVNGGVVGEVIPSRGQGGNSLSGAGMPSIPVSFFALRGRFFSYYPPTAGGRSVTGGKCGTESP